jgi:hypothetical protein
MLTRKYIVEPEEDNVLLQATHVCKNHIYSSAKIFKTYLVKALIIYLLYVT